MPLFDGIHVHGLTLSLLLQSSAVSNQQCDGLLFGRVHRRHRQEFRDDDAGVVHVEEVHLHITSFLCFAGPGSFYDSTGNVSEPQLAALSGAGHDPVVGWFSVRPSPTSPAQPSMRETAVSASLQRLLDSQPDIWGRTAGLPHPVLLMVLHQRQDHNGATLTLSYRVFQHLNPDRPTGKLLVVPTDLRILSLQRHTGAGPGQGACPAQLAAGAIMTNHAMHDVLRSSSNQQGPGTGGASAANQVLAATAAASVQQVIQLEEYHRSQLRALTEVCQLVSHQSSQLISLQLEQQQLVRHLAGASSG